jgi:GYD domain
LFIVRTVNSTWFRRSNAAQKAADPILVVSLVFVTDKLQELLVASCAKGGGFHRLLTDEEKTLWTLGSFDGVVIFDAADDESATAAMLQLASQGNVCTTTARAFGSSEIEKVIGSLGK